MSSSSVPLDGSGDHAAQVSGAAPPAVVVATTSKDRGTPSSPEPEDNARQFVFGTSPSEHVEREVNFRDARRVFESGKTSPSPSLPIDLSTTASKTTELMTPDSPSPPRLAPEVTLKAEGQGPPGYSFVKWIPCHKKNQSIGGQHLLSTSPSYTRPVEGGDAPRRKLSIARRISISTDVDAVGELSNLADLKVAVEAVQAANNMSTPSQRNRNRQPSIVTSWDRGHQKDGNNLDKIDIKQGERVEGEVDSNEGNVLVVRELFSAKRKRHTSADTGSVAKDEVSLISHLDLDSNCSSFVNDYDWDRRARKKAFKKNAEEDDINSLSVLSSAETEVKLDRFPETMRSNDVFALLSPSKGLFEVRTCPQHFNARRELQTFLTDEANKSFLEESCISMNVAIGSPPPVIHDVSVMVIDGPEWPPYSEDAVQLFDKERNRFGKIKKIADEVTHVEVLQNKMIIMDISPDQLKPHPSAMLRCGQYVLLGDWYGMISGVERSVRLKLSDGRKVKLSYEDNDAEGTRLSYVSGGKYSPWFQAGDIYSDPTVPTYPGQSIKVDAKTAEEHLTSPMRRCSNWVAALARRVLRRNVAIVEGEGAENICFDAVVEKVSIKSVSVIWIDSVEGSLELVCPKCIIKDEATINALQLLGPDPQSFTQLGSLRMFTIQENSEQVDKNGWRKEMLLRFMSSTKRAPPASHDEVDVASKRFTLSRGTKPKRCKTGESVVVKVLLKYKMVEVEWEDGVKENIEMPKVLQMLNQNQEAARRSRTPSVTSRTESTGCPLSTNSLQPSPHPNVTEFPTNSEDLEIDGLSDRTYHISTAVDTDTAAAVMPNAIVGLAVNDFVVDATKPFSDIVKEYGIVRKIFPQDCMVKVEWFELNDNFLTSKIDPEVKRTEVSAFDLSFMKIGKDPPHGITWHSSTHYSSEVVMKRSGVCQQDFKVGFVTGVNEDGKLIVSCGANTWLLWPCEVNNIRKVSYQNELGEWKVTQEPSTFVNSHQPISTNTSVSAVPRSQSTLALDLLGGRVTLSQSTVSEVGKYMETDLDGSYDGSVEGRGGGDFIQPH